MNQIQEFAREHWFWILLAAIIGSGVSFKIGSFLGIITGIVSLILVVLILVVAVPALWNLVGQYM